MAKSKKFWALLLTLVMVAALFPASALAADTPTWNVSKSKTATALSNNQTTVTLSLPSAETTAASDIVFVLDVSSCGDETLASMQDMLAKLTASQVKTGAAINIGVVVFRGSAATCLSLSDINSKETAAAFLKLTDVRAKLDAIKNDINQSEKQVKIIADAFPGIISSGSNLHSGLQAAQTMLAAKDGVSANRKYVITVSDGITYLFNDENGATKAIYDQADYYYAECVLQGWTKNFSLTDTKFSWSNYYNGVCTAVAADGDTYVSDFKKVCNEIGEDYSAGRFIYNGSTTEIAAFNKAGFQRVANDKDFSTHALGVDRSVYECCKTYSAMKAAGYQCYYIQPTSSYGQGTFPYEFANALNTIAGKTGTINFDSIQNDIIYAIEKGTVTDIIGNDFDLASSGSACPFKVTVKGVEQAATQDSQNKNLWNFGTEDETTGKYPYCVEYKPATGSSKEQLLWSINTPVENAKTVQLSYTLNLVNRSSAAGSHTADTNVSATLDYTSTGSVTSGTETFPVPSVSYTVSGGGGEVIIPEEPVPGAELPADLNSTDHIQYIYGYPDGTVRPNANITRAKVSTAFYALLTTARRDAILTSTNSFTDVKGGTWYTKSVSSMANGGYVKGYEDSSFRPNAPITRAEFVTIAAAFMNAKAGDVSFTDVSKTDWFYQYVSTAVSYKWISGYPDGSFRPNQPITRAEAMTIINTMLARGVDAEGLITGIKAWPDNIQGQWYYYDVIEATNNHLYTGSRPSEKWTSLNTGYVYDIDKYVKP